MAWEWIMSVVILWDGLWALTIDRMNHCVTPDRVLCMHISCIYINCIQIQTFKKVNAATIHDDVIKWEHFPCYWPFVRGIHRSPVNSLHKGQWRGTLKFPLFCALNKRLCKQSWGWWFETLSRSLRRHCKIILWKFTVTNPLAWCFTFWTLLIFFCVLQPYKVIPWSKRWQDVDIRVCRKSLTNVIGLGERGRRTMAIG